MTKQDFLIAILSGAIITLAAIAIGYGSVADMNRWSVEHGAQEELEVQVSDEGSLNVQDMYQSGGVK